MRPMCKQEGCTNIRIKNGVCIKHGAEKPKCIIEGCTNRRRKNGVCVKHGAEEPKCIIEGCTNNRRKNGVCIKHGSDQKVLKCIIEGCTNNRKKNKVCVKHGAEEPRCSIENCSNKKVNNGVCHKHGAKYRKCEHNKQKDFCQICSPLKHLKNIVNGRIWHALNSKKIRKNNKTIEYLGLDIESYKWYLEQQFEDGMSWDNYGEWQIDHIIPLFYKKDNEDITENTLIDRLHFSNTQPLWRFDNISKSNRFCGSLECGSY
jgi:hypothetical protein